MSAILLGVGRWMARRNGRVLARSLAAQLNRCRRSRPDQPALFHHEEILDHRPGWQKVRQYVYQYRTAERLELKPRDSSGDWMVRVAQVEIAPLGQGLRADLHQEFLKEAVAGASDWWNKNEPGKG